MLLPDFEYFNVHVWNLLSVGRLCGRLAVPFDVGSRPIPTGSGNAEPQVVDIPISAGPKRQLITYVANSQFRRTCVVVPA